ELRAAERQSEAATQMLAEARAILAPLEARPALARAEAIEQRFAAPSAEAHPSGLSTREEEVLRLVAEGLSDAQVADRLFLSLYPVKAPLRSIYSKLGVSSRTAAVRIATAPTVLPFGLTARELDVLRLVAEGLTDPQIAERLYVSRNTVNA